MIDIFIALFLAIAGVGIGAFKRFGALEPAMTKKALRFLGIILVGVAVAFLTGVLSIEGKSNVGTVQWREDVKEALEQAKGEARPALLDATADWCAACKKLERDTFSDQRVVSALHEKGFVTIRIDLTDFEEGRKVLKSLGLETQSLPFVVFFMPDGRVNDGLTLYDFEPPDLFLHRVERSSVYHEHAPTPVEMWLGEGGIFLAILLCFLAGVAVSLTPCVYPTIPLVISAAGARPSVPFKSRMLHASIFVGGLVIVYSGLGVISALVGKGFGSQMGSWPVAVVLCLVFFALAASYAGFFTFPVSGSLAMLHNRVQGGVAKALVLGMTAGIVAAPCAGPVVVGILSIVAVQRQVIMGFVLMFFFALGLSLIYVAVAAVTAFIKKRPQGGTWSERIDLVFAVLFVLVALYYGKLGMNLFY
jgi:thiol:disulfide interchange protein